MRTEFFITLKGLLDEDLQPVDNEQLREMLRIDAEEHTGALTELRDALLKAAKIFREVTAEGG